jgi:hypothetical protein
MSKLSTRQVTAILQSAKDASLASVRASKLQEQRTDALNYYLGDVSKHLPKIEGRSGVVSFDVSDTVDGLMPGLMDIFAGSEDVVRFDPVSEEDVEAAEQESDYVGHVFMQKNPGFNILQTMFKDGLISKTGIVKVWWETKKTEERETYTNQDPEAFMALAENPELELIEHNLNDDGTVDGTFVKRKEYGCARVANVPPEEFGLSRRTQRIQDTDYCFHEPIGGVPAADLIAEGYDKDQIESLPAYTSTDEGTETRARDSVDESSSTLDEDHSINEAMRPILVTEHFIRMDYEGDGKVQLYKIKTGGEKNTVLKKNGKPDIMAFDYVPFAVAHADPIPHRFFGRSIADKTMETQRIKTVLQRDLLDNLYLINNQQIEVAEQHATDNTIDDLMNRKKGGIVRTKNPGGINPVVIQPIADKILPHLQYFDMEREWRTGVTREGQGLDAEALQNQTATAAKQVHSAAQAKMKLIARNFADGVEDLFWLLHAVIRKNGSKAETVRLKNKWVMVDPRQWKARDDMTINVGLGHGGKAEQIQQTMMLINLQAQALANGMQSMVKPKHLYNSAQDICKLMEKRDVSLYFDDPGDAEMQPQPDPKLIEIQMKAEIEKLQAAADIETNKQKTEADIMLAREKFALDSQLKREEHAMKMEEARIKMVGTAVSAASKSTGTDDEGKPKPPDTDMIARLMEGMNQPKSSGTSKKRARKVGPGEWEIEETTQ